MGKEEKIMHTLEVGVAQADITPALEVGLLTSSVRRTWAPFQRIRKRLMARAIVISQEEEIIAFISLDLLGLTDTSTSGWKKFKTLLSAGIDEEKIVVACTHTHTAPESLALTSLWTTPAYALWMRDVQEKVSACIEKARKELQRCTLHIGIGELEGFSLQRRIPTAKGMAISDAFQPIPDEMFLRGPIDKRIRAIRFITAEGRTIATIVHGICHPVHEMCLPQVSPDYPGELCEALDSSGLFGMSLFLNGAAGDINPSTVSEGQEFSKKHGRAIAEVVQKMEFRAIAYNAIGFSHREFSLPVRRFPDAPLTDNIARIRVARFGNLAIVFLPGEPFVQTGLDIEASSPFEHTLVAGYSENSMGYIPPPYAFQEGGYETGPGKWSYLEDGSESVIKQTVMEMMTNI